MSVVPVRLWNRALVMVAALAVGLAAATVPAATPASAAQTDLAMFGTAEATLNIHTSVLAHRFNVDVYNATVPAGQVVVTAAFPSGVRPIPSTFQVTNTHTTWNCSVTTSALTCRNTSPFVPNTGGARFSVGFTVSGPMTTQVVSRIDPFGTVTETSEANNVGVFTYHFVQ